MRLTRGLRGGGSLSLLSCSCSSTTGLRSQHRLIAAPNVSAFSHLLYRNGPGNIRMAAPADKTWSLITAREWFSYGQSQGRRISRDVVVRWDTRGKKLMIRPAAAQCDRKKMTPHGKLGSMRAQPCGVWSILTRLARGEAHYLSYPRG